MTHQKLAKKVFETAHLTGEFLLRSGQTSTEYFDKYRFESRPTLLQEIARQMATQLPDDIDLLAGLEMGGIPIATALSLHTGIPTIFVRKKAKGYGTCRFAEGAEIKGKKICIIEDVITTGGQVVLSTKDLRNGGAQIDHVCCVIYRGRNQGHGCENRQEEKLTQIGLIHHSLFTMDQLKQASES